MTWRYTRCLMGIGIAALLVGCGDDDNARLDGSAIDGGPDAASLDAGALRAAVLVPNLADDSLSEVDIDALRVIRKMPVLSRVGGVGVEQISIDCDRIVLSESTHHVPAVMRRRTIQ